VIDVVGLRPGITYEEAANIVLCDNPMLVAELDTSTSFNIQTYGQKVRQGFGARFAEARVEKTARQFRKEMQDEALARGTNAVRQDMKPGQVKFHVGSLPGNQGLAQYMQVGVIDQAAGYAAITGTESALHKLDEDRKAKELKDATKNADVPKL
jgi:hypothetical protein